MIASLLPIGYAVAFLAIVAGCMWLFERIAKLIGGKYIWLLFLCIIPLALSLITSIHNWEQLSWWQRILFPASGPVFAAVVLWLGFLAVNPADALLLIGGTSLRFWRWLTGKKRVHGRDA